MGGWIKIYQTIREHWIWERPRYLKWWLDLLMLAEWKDSKRLVKSVLVTIKRGQLIASVHYLQERWVYKDDDGVKRKPSEHTILKFLSLLEADQMISRAKHPVIRATIIAIVNYADYQQNNATGCNGYGNDPCNEGCNDPCTEDKNNKNIKDNREGKSGKSEKRFSPPSIEEVDSYIREKGYTVDAERFVNFYESKGRKVGNSPMKDWRAAVRTWEKRDGRGARKTTTAGGTTLGVGEWIDEQGNRLYGSGKRVPLNAPPRPGADYYWSKESNSWIAGV